MLRAGGNAVDAAVAAVLMSFVGRVAADRAGRGRLHARPHGRRARATCSTSSSPRRGRARDARAGAARADRGRVLGRRRPGLPRRRRRRAASTGRRSGWREALDRFGTARARRPVGAGRRRGARRASRSTPIQAYLFDDPRRDLPRHAGGDGDLRARRPPAAGRASGSASPSSPTCSSASAREGPRFLYDGDVAAARQRLGAGARRADHARRPRRLRGRSSASPSRARYRGREVLTNPPPSSGGILIAVRARAARAARPPRRRARARRGDGRDQPRPRPRSSSTASTASGYLEQLPRAATRSTRWPREIALAARLDDPHLGDRRRRRAARRVTCSNGSCSGVVVPGHGHPPQQHARRGGPEPARLPSPRAAAGACRA